MKEDIKVKQDQILDMKEKIHSSYAKQLQEQEKMIDALRGELSIVIEENKKKLKEQMKMKEKIETFKT